MLEVSALEDFVNRERQAAESTTTAAELLSDAALVALGRVIGGLQITDRAKGGLSMRCQENFSRFRSGDRVRLTCGDRHLGAVIREVSDAGRALSFEVGSTMSRQLPVGPWIASEETTDLSASVLSALKKLQPGAPGWGFFKLLTGQKQLDERAGLAPAIAQHEALYQTLTESASCDLDGSQREAFFRCLLVPPGFAVQGPPGTGKTLVLAFVAEGLVRLGKRVAIVALTHQAVNNALSTVHSLFPQRKLAKIGDAFQRESLAEDIRITARISREDEKDRNLIPGMTFMSGIHRLMLSTSGLAPDVLIIDEAGQLPLAQGAVAGLCGAGSVLLFGDDMQMPPVFESDVAEDPLATSVFAHFHTQQPSATEMLLTTYRLNRQLCHAIGTTFYGNEDGTRLMPSAGAVNRVLTDRCAQGADPSVRSALIPDSPLVWFQVPGRSSTQYNRREAEIAADIVGGCLNAGLDARDIAVVTPFRRQAVLIRNLLSDQLRDQDPLPVVDTVERVQGLTVEVIVVSMCAAEPNYVASIAGFLFSPNRMNVAVSRARTKAIVLSSPDVFNVVPGEYSAILGRDKCLSLLKGVSRAIAANP